MRRSISTATTTGSPSCRPALAGEARGAGVDLARPPRSVTRPEPVAADVQVGLPMISTSPGPVAVTLAVRATRHATLPAVSVTISASSARQCRGVEVAAALDGGAQLSRPCRRADPAGAEQADDEIVGLDRADAAAGRCPTRRDRPAGPSARSTSRLPEPTTAAVRRSRVVSVDGHRAGAGAGIAAPGGAVAADAQGPRPGRRSRPGRAPSASRSARAAELRPVVRVDPIGPVDLDPVEIGDGIAALGGSGRGGGGEGEKGEAARS